MSPASIRARSSGRRHSPTATYQASFDERGDLILGIADMAIYDDFDPQPRSHRRSRATMSPIWVVDANLPSPTLDFIVGEAATRQRRSPPLPSRRPRRSASRRSSTASPSSSPTGARRWRSSTGRARTERPRRPILPPSSAFAAPAWSSPIPPAPLAAAIGGETRSFAPLRAEVVERQRRRRCARRRHASTASPTAARSSKLIRFGLAAAALAVESDGHGAAASSPPGGSPSASRRAGRRDDVRCRIVLSEEFARRARRSPAGRGARDEHRQPRHALAAESRDRARGRGDRPRRRRRAGGDRRLRRRDPHRPHRATCSKPSPAATAY